MLYRSGRWILALSFCMSPLLHGEVHVQGVGIDQKANGTVITIHLDNTIPRNQVSAWFKETGWFYVTLHGATVDTTRSWPFSRTGAVTAFEAHQVAESAQLNFRLSEPVESFEISTSSEGKVLLTLRLPLSESIAAIERAWDKPTSGEVTVGPPEELTWRAAVPHSLMFLGAGLAARGSIRSEQDQMAAGVVLLIAGWLLDSQREKALPSP